MAYGDFTLEEIEERFGIKNRIASLFPELAPIEPSDFLKQVLSVVRGLPLRSEKSKSEALVLPLLLELRHRNNDFFTIYSGENLAADEARGLKGECDFILAKDIHSYSINYPIIQIVEAKKGDLDLGVPQCAAQMIGAKVFNEKKGVQLERIYGCVTNGHEWLFMKLEGELFIDERPFYLVKLNELLAVFQSIIDYYKAVLQ
jgi:hypothetical protein